MTAQSKHLYRNGFYFSVIMPTFIKLLIHLLGIYFRLGGQVCYILYKVKKRLFSSKDAHFFFAEVFYEKYGKGNHRANYFK